MEEAVFEVSLDAELGHGQAGFEGEVFGDAHFELAGALERLEGEEFGCAELVVDVGHLLKAGDAVLGGDGLCGEEVCFDLGFGFERDFGEDERDGGVFKDAGGIAVGVAHDDAAGDVWSVAIDAGELHG